MKEKKSKIKKVILIILGVFILAAIAVLAVYITTSKDTWICTNGKWVRHAYPFSKVSPMPTSGCGLSDSTGQTSLKTYTNDKYGFGFQYPQNLDTEVVSGEPGVFAGLESIILNRNNGGGYVATIATEKNSNNKTLDQVVDSIVQSYGPYNGINASDIKVAGQDAKLYISRDPSAEYNLVNMGIVVIKGDLIIEVMGGTKDKNIIDQILASFKFTK